MKKNKFDDTFRKITSRVSSFAGSPSALIVAIAIIVVWATTGPHYQWSSQHSLIINSITTIITFLLCFIIQGSQNRDSRAIQIKLNAIIAALEGANNNLVGLESKAEAELDSAVEEIKQQIEEGENQ